jgi:L-alanine-DL-glutamate epimerase-like enolase superfamily enzyme
MGQCMKDLLLGADPLDIDGLWRRIYLGTAMNGRRGAVVHTLGAVEMALWDLKGKALGKPVHELLGGAVRPTIVPYASLQPAGHGFEEYRDALVEAAVRARSLGFKAVKSEVTLNGPYAHSGLCESYDRHTEVVAAVRKALGPDVTLMIDVQYLWDDAASCLAVVRDWAEFDLYFLETPLWSDHLDEYRKLAEAAPMPIAAGEWLATRHEFVELMDRGRVQVAQPDVGRVGGLGEAKAVCAMAAARGITIVPHCWKTGISIFIEYLPPALCIETLRKELAAEDLRLENGEIPLPTKPGLGFELNRDALHGYAVA